jgi:predicted dehydrogenase
MPQKNVNVGILGCGYIANEIHLPAFEAAGAKVLAVCDKNENSARETAKRTKSRYYINFLDLLEKEKELDIIDICTPPQSHSLLACQAMEAGCHVLVEKPLALSVSEAKKMANVARKNGVKLCVDHNSLFNPVVMKARNVVRRGDVGDVIRVDIKYLKNKYEDQYIVDKDNWCHKLPGGIFGEVLAHPIYLLLEFLRRLNPVTVCARKLGNFDWIANDELLVVCDAENALGTITISCNSPIGMCIMDIFGTKMNLHLDLWTLTMVNYKHRKQSSFSLALNNAIASFQTLFGITSAFVKELFGLVSSGHYALIQRFVDSVRNDMDSPVSIENAVETVRLLEMICAQIDKK